MTGRVSKRHTKKNVRHRQHSSKQRNRHLANKRNKTHKRLFPHSTKNHMIRNNKQHSRTLHGGFGPGAGPVGYSYQPGNVGTWPGVAGFNYGQGNHYAYKGTPSGMFDPPLSSRNDPVKYQSGGGFIPQDLVNLGRSVGYGLSSLVSNVTGSVNKPVNPLPTKDQVIDANYKILNTSIPDLNKITYNASSQVSKI
jgi:hypothetical protein